MKFIIFLFFILSNEIYSQENLGVKNITCGFQQCIPDFTPSTYLEQVDKTIIDLGRSNPDNVNILLPENQEPRSLVLIMENNSAVGRNLNASLNSKIKEKDSANLVLIGDLFNELKINLNGFDGETGKDASILCAEKFLDGSYGESSRNFFIARRTSNPNLPQDRCDELDSEHIQETKFSCEDSEFTQRDFPTVEVNRVKFKQRCVGTSIRYKCLQRKVRIRCEWSGYARGYAQQDKWVNYPCSNPWGGGNCNYNSSHSCWRGRDLSNSYNGIKSTAEDNVNPKWALIYDNNRCQFGAYGGVFAYQQSEELNELRYLQAQETNTVDRLCESDFPYPIAPGWRFNRVVESFVTTPGLDPDTLLPLPGSNWEVAFTDFFTPCQSLGPFVTLNSEIQTWTAFGEIGGNCSDASIPEDVNNLIPWNASGTIQDPTFGTEKLLCNPQNCPVQNITKEKDLNFDVIDPTSGANGTKQGTGILLIYDYNESLSQLQSRAGVAGNGGNNDLPELKNTKYCVKIDDATTKGIDSLFGKSPVVNYDIYNWEGLKINRGQPSGQVPDFSNNGLQIYKKLDSSLRYLIKNSLFE